MYLRMAIADDPFLSFIAVMAAQTIFSIVGFLAPPLDLDLLLFLGDFALFAFAAFFIGGDPLRLRLLDLDLDLDLDRERLEPGIFFRVSLKTVQNRMAGSENLLRIYAHSADVVGSTCRCNFQDQWRLRCFINLCLFVAFDNKRHSYLRINMCKMNKFQQLRIKTFHRTYQMKIHDVIWYFFFMFILEIGCHFLLPVFEK